MGNNLQSYGTVAAAGSNSTDATLLTYHVNILTGADNVKGVKLPLLNPEIDDIHLFNNTQSSAIIVYPSTNNSLFGFIGSYVFAGYQYTQFKRLSINQWGVSDPGYRFGAESVNAGGSTQGDATALSLGASYWTVNNANGVRGVKLPLASTSTIGIVRYLINFASGALLLWPNTDNSINFQSNNTSLSIPSGKMCTCLCTNSTIWSVQVGA